MPRRLGRRVKAGPPAWRCALGERLEPVALHLADALWLPTRELSEIQLPRPWQREQGFSVGFVRRANQLEDLGKHFDRRRPFEEGAMRRELREDATHRPDVDGRTILLRLKESLRSSSLEAC